jgi:hypothetical protein
MEKRGEIICSWNYRLPHLNRNRRQARPTAASTLAQATRFTDRHEQMTAGINPASAGPGNAKGSKRFTAPSSSRRYPLRISRNRFAMSP